MCNNQNKFNCSVSVVPIVKNSEIYIDIIQKSMQKVIPYIEELTQVRYYPVTTYIVDEYIIKSQYVESIEEGIDERRVEDIKEVLKFLSWIAIGFHTQRLYPGGSNLDYRNFSTLTGGQLEELKWKSEGLCFYFEEYLKNKDGCKIDELYIQGISKYADVSINFFDDFNKILDIFSGIIKISDFKNIRLEYDDRRGYYKLKVWQDNLSAKDFEKIKKYIEEFTNEECKWSNKLSDLIQVTLITLKMLNSMLNKYKEATNEFRTIIKEMHTYGVYLHKSESSNAQLAKLINRNKLPASIEQFNTGKVLICIDKIIERVKQVYEANPTIDRNWLIENLITALLIHEHTHAANFEGVRYNHPQPLYIINKDYKPYTDYKDKVVIEAIAEWAELNYFRDNTLIYKIIEAHMNCGDVKNWPYAGAAYIENRFEKLGLTDFQAIFNMSRVSYKDAYQILK